MGPRILILGMFQAVFLFTTSLASNLPEGTITAINMGWIMMQMPEVIFAMALATAAFPAMSQLVARGDRPALQDTVSGTLRAILLLVLPSTVALWMLGRSYIALLFGYGAFGARAADMVYWTTAAFTVGLVGHSLLELAARVFYAHCNTGATALNVGLCIALAPLLGGPGLALANSIAVTVQSSVLLWLVWRSKVRFGWRQIWQFGWRAGIALSAMAGAIWLLTQRQPQRGHTWTALLGSAVGGFIYLGTLALLNREEASSLLRRARQWLG
jgi:putative peptidoglycan lipid II flippase